MYSGGSVVGKASIIYQGISPTPPLIFTGGQKVRNLASHSTSLNYEVPAFENAARYLNSITHFYCGNDRHVLGPRAPENRSVQVARLLQRDRAAGWVSNGQKWKTGTERQYLRTI